MDNLGFVVAGYLLTGSSLLGYVVWLHRRARRARARVAALSEAREA